MTVPFSFGGATFIAGGQVELNRAVGGDALLAGGSVDVEAMVGQDLYAAGGIVGVAHTIGGDARIAAGRVLITSSSVIGGSATIAAGNVVVNGRVAESLLISAGRTEVNGEILGDLFVSGGSLSLGPNAVVHGKLEYQGAQPANIAKGAQLQGGFTETTAATVFRPSIGLAAALLAGFIAVAAVLLALVPRASRYVGHQLRTKPITAPILGLALFISLPIVGLLLMLTVVGIPLGAFAIALWLALSTLAYFASAIALGDAVVERSARAKTSMRVLAAALALLALFALWRVPYLGWAVWLLALFFGMGAMALAAFNALRRRAR